jgi:hypothetical protein
MRMRTEQSGALTPAAIILAIFLLFLGGLVTDGGRHLNARSTALAYAREGARAGAAMIKLTEANAVIDVPRAREAIEQFCAQAIKNNPHVTQCEFSGTGKEGADSDTAVQKEYVDVLVSVTTPTLLLGIFGTSSVTSSATGRADAVQGIRTPGVDTGLPSFVTPSYPTISVSIPTGGPPGTVYPPSTGYPTQNCQGQPITLPVTVGITCQTTTVPTPPPPHPTVVTSTYPTTQPTRSP